MDIGSIWIANCCSEQKSALGKCSLEKQRPKVEGRLGQEVRGDVKKWYFLSEVDRWSEVGVGLNLVPGHYF